MSEAQPVSIRSSNLFGEAPSPANGDPYIALLSRTNNNGVAIERETAILGTGFDSFDDIAAHIQRIIEHPDQHDLDLEFTPDRAEVFGISGTISFE
jgi:hypothetical protein